MKRFIQYITTFVCLTALFTGCNSDAEMTFLTRDGECKLLATATEVDIGTHPHGSRKTTSASVLLVLPVRISK